MEKKRGGNVSPSTQIWLRFFYIFFLIFVTHLERISAISFEILIIIQKNAFKDDIIILNITLTRKDLMLDVYNTEHFISQLKLKNSIKY